MPASTRSKASRVSISTCAYTAQHLEEGADDLQRKPFIWDNHISNDSRIRTTGGDAGVQGEACHLGHRLPGERLQDPKFVAPVPPKP
jgi:hypothetical protein